MRCLCLELVVNWMMMKKLKFNPNKMEVLLDGVSVDLVGEVVCPVWQSHFCQQDLLLVSSFLKAGSTVV